MTQIKRLTIISEISKSNKSVIQTSYDIVKALDCELTVETKKGEGTEFIILLPIV